MKQMKRPKKKQDKLSIFFNNHIRLSACLIFAFVVLFGVALTYYFMPILLNYGPGTINTEFDKDVSGGLTYFMQYALVYVAITLAGTICILHETKELNNIKILRDEAYINYKSKEKLSFLITKCITLPQKLFFIIALLPVIAISLVFIVLGFTSFADVKVLLVIVIISILGASFANVFFKELFKSVLTFIGNTETPKKSRFSLTTSSIIQISSIVLVCIIYTFLLMYSNNMDDKSVLLRKHYTNEITSLINNTQPQTRKELYDILKSIELMSDNDSVFIIDEKNNFINFNNQTVSDFFKKYALELAPTFNNTIYDYYGTENQGIIVPIKVGEEKIKVVVKYDLTNTLLATTFTNLIIILTYCCIAIYFFSTSITNEISIVAENLNQISKNSKKTFNDKLPVTSNDEIGDLIVAFNEIQALTAEHVAQIESNQEQLLEKERLASLGQMIGGIAHNMKTPIMSIAGAAEALTELIGEYVASIDNPTVTSEDHKDIAKDMLDWTSKIKTHTSYMSDIITAVKGQASQLGVSDYSSFTIYDLIKKSDILLKHELKNSLITLETRFDCDPAITLTGDINNLIQVLVNLVSNAIQSYNGTPNKKVSLAVDSDLKNVYIYIIDNGSGMTQEVQEKLFKEMITTKGKNGTGLGLYMSYSTIKGKFGGDIEFESKPNIGTTFKITLPINKENQ